MLFWMNCSCNHSEIRGPEIERRPPAPTAMSVTTTPTGRFISSSLPVIIVPLAELFETLQLRHTVATYLDRIIVAFFNDFL